MTSMRKLKLNDFCQFPEVLNMAKYMKDHISENETCSDVIEDSKHMFKLTGVLVHSGTADSGHYYSFIKSDVDNKVVLYLLISII